MKVWYVSYGSNTNYNRFLCYITGGSVGYMTRLEQGCKNQTLPTKVNVLQMNRELKFLEKASKWDNKGVAFISPYEDRNHTTYGVRYLIDMDQFLDIVKQENGINVNDEINLSIDELKQGVAKNLFQGKWYSNIIHLGEIDGYQAYTFTCDEERFLKQSNPPSVEYLSVILQGLIGHCIEEEKKTELLSNFSNIQGVKDEYTLEELRKLSKLN